MRASSWLSVLAAMAVAALSSTRACNIKGELDSPHTLRDEAFVTSQRCSHCHEAHAESWGATYHRTMTQEATPTSVLAAFDGRSAEYLGWTAEMHMQNGRHVMLVRGPAGERVRYEVDRTVGSHRYQQYLERRGDTWWRLPWAWHVEEARWFHMNGAFLTPDPEDAASAEDHERHVVRWNDNCVFCHNVAPNPGLRDGHFETEVAELGVACEACHGPGEAHASRNQSPLRRYMLHGSEMPDPTIINPDRLSAERSADICGRCHGQRITPDVRPFLEHGDPFIPGQDLARYSEPLWADTTLQGESVFTARFWPDGSPRLTAYEYQGWLQARCTAESDLSCTTCHGMHEGDPAGQLRLDASRDGDISRGNESCRSCHSLDDGHGGHRPTQAQCVDCHMPRNVYGVLDAHRSHRISTPEPTRFPHACGLCHLDEEPRFFEPFESSLDAPGERAADDDANEEDGVPDDDAVSSVDGTSDETDNETAVGLRWLLAGDPIERALAADAYGRADDVLVPNAQAALAAAMEFDAYPAVRTLAWRALRRRLARDGHTLDVTLFDPLASAPVRRDQLDALSIGSPLPGPLVRRLRAQAQSVNIEIGE